MLLSLGLWANNDCEIDRTGSSSNSNRVNEQAVLHSVKRSQLLNNLKWNTHIINICAKANRTLGFLKRNLYSSPQDVKEAAYEGI